MRIYTEDKNASGSVSQYINGRYVTQYFNLYCDRCDCKHPKVCVNEFDEEDEFGKIDLCWNCQNELRNGNKMAPKRKTDPKDNFLMHKYKYYLSKVIRKLGNRYHNESFFWKDNDFNLQNKAKNRCDELVIDERELLNQFIAEAKDNNIHEINPIIYKKALIDMIGKLKDFFDPWDFEGCSANFFIEKQRIGNTVIYKITFGAE